MTLSLIPLILFIGVIFLIIRAQMLHQGRGRSQRRTYGPDQNRHAHTPVPDPGLLDNSIRHAPSSYADSVSYSDASSSIYSADSSVAGVSSDANSGSVDYGGGADYGSSVDTCGARLC